MGLLSWILFGLVAGALARLLVPGRQSLGCIATLAVGIAGALIGGFVGEAVFGEEIEFGWDLRPFLLAVAGAVGLLLLLQAVSGRRRF